MLMCKQARKQVEIPFSIITSEVQSISRLVEGCSYARTHMRTRMHKGVHTYPRTHACTHTPGYSNMHRRHEFYSLYILEQPLEAGPAYHSFSA